jgi:hypothetical protein
MTNKFKINVIIILAVATIINTCFLFCDKPTQPVELEPIILTDTDTIYKEIRELEIKSDTIKLYYEKKVKDYRIMPTDKRVELFAARINR